MCVQWGECGVLVVWCGALLVQIQRAIQGQQEFHPEFLMQGENTQ